MSGSNGSLERSMNKILRLIAIFMLISGFPLFAALEETGIDLEKGNEAYAEKDYYSALVFYSRAMGSYEIRDGVIWYKTADSYARIKGEDPFLKALYTISFYYLIQKDPDHRYIDILKTKIDLSLKVTPGVIKKTRNELASRMAESDKKTRKISLEGIKQWFDGWRLFFRDSITGKIKSLSRPLTDYRSGGIDSGIKSLVQNWEVLVLAWIIAFFPTGILLPFIIGNYRAARGKPKGLFLSYLLWFHWGSLGVHRFYLGHYGRGLLLLLTFGGLGVGWLIDGILLASGIRQSAGPGRSTSHRSLSGGNHSRSVNQNATQMSRRNRAEDNFDDFNLLSSGEDL